MQPVFNVTEFVDILNQTFELSFPYIVIEGEVASFKPWNQRLAFFDLKDDRSTINCMIPLGSLDVRVEDGMKVRVTAGPKVTRKGRLTVNVMRVNPVGEGAIKRAFELLRNQLEQEGLFALERKRQLPKYPQTLGLLTSIESAAYHDFMKILNLRWGGLEVIVYHSQVQGAAAVSQIVSGIDYFDQLENPVDVLVLTRGGGSLEDLAAFNNEKVARAVASSRTPIVVGVGHEVDTTLADLASDSRAATPTDAARLVVPDRQEVLAQLRRAEEDMSLSVDSYCDELNTGIDSHLESLSHVLRPLRVNVEQLAKTLSRQINNINNQLLVRSDAVDKLRHSLVSSLDKHVVTKRNSVRGLARILGDLNPEAVLRKGYALVRKDDRIVVSLGQVSVGDRLVIQLSQGLITSEVVNVENDVKF